MTRTRRPSGTWGRRTLIFGFSVLLTLLFYWLLGFVITDIGDLDGPDYQELESALLDPELVEHAEQLQEEIEQTQQEINNQNRRQELLRDSTQNSQQTMNQLLDFQRLSMEKNVTPSQEEQQALAKSQQRFLANQERYQELNTAVVQLHEKLQELQDERAVVREQLRVAREPIRDRYQQLDRRHQVRLAVVKLAVLIPLLLLAGLLFVRFRGTAYTSITYAFGIAVLLKVLMVMWEHFPRRYFNYILVVTSILAILGILLRLIRGIVAPAADARMKQRQEAYESFLCPVCGFPMRRGPLKYRTWSRRSIRKMSLAAGAAPAADEPYTCPSCATRLYEACSQCGEMRHSLLPACQHCGHQINLFQGPADVPGVPEA